jgi:DNA (cytosine-5)-methyltransferase 1
MKETNRKENENGTTSQNEILCLLQETYGTQAVVEWGIAVLASLQQTDLLQQELYERSFQNETENRDKLGSYTLPSPKIVAEWLLRDMRKQQECGRTSQGRQLLEQQFRKLTEVVPELPHERTSRCEQMFNMWQEGKGLWLLQQTLYQIQEIWESVNMQGKTGNNAVVRRLTPLEATRLQGLPDGWVDIGEWVDEKGKKHKEADAPKYKALGNSIALPYWQFLADRMVKQLKADGVEQPTMASLFSGIGGFELVYKRAGCEPIWASEIENFPIAVCKKHFGDEETGIIGDVEKYL